MNLTVFSKTRTHNLFSWYLLISSYLFSRRKQTLFFADNSWCYYVFHKVLISQLIFIFFVNVKVCFDRQNATLQINNHATLAENSRTENILKLNTDLQSTQHAWPKLICMKIKNSFKTFQQRLHIKNVCLAIDSIKYTSYTHLFL